MPNQPIPGATAVRAAVDAGALTTSYLRAGGGAAVLLLRAPRRDGAADPLFGALAERFRVIAPDACAPAPARDGVPDPPFSSWLRDFLDGLGLTRASIVAEEELGLRALSFALSDPARVASLVLLFRDAPDPLLPGGDGADLLGRSGHPLLVVRLVAGDAGTAAGIVDFLGRG